MSKFYWFGDSWVFGSELEKEPNIQSDKIKNFTFAKLVSDHYNAECINLSEPGTSNDSLPLTLFKNFNNINPVNDTIFLCLTSAVRVSFLDDNGKMLTVLPSIQDQARRPVEHPHWKEWYKYFDSPLQQVFNYERNVNLLYHWCKNANVKFYFLNGLTTHTQTVFDITSDDAWLLPRNKCLANFILPLEDKEFGGLVLEDREWLTDSQWADQQQHINRYINPCFCHPNIAGHHKIAQEIIKLLDSRHL